MSKKIYKVEIQELLTREVKTLQEALIITSDFIVMKKLFQIIVIIVKL